jgi:excinuclease ABC subunit C
MERKTSINPKIEDILKHLPSNPGVYLMKDENDQIIYVGKAKNP